MITPLRLLDVPPRLAKDDVADFSLGHAIFLGKSLLTDSFVLIPVANLAHALFCEFRQTIGFSSCPWVIRAEDGCCPSPNRVQRILRERAIIEMEGIAAWWIIASVQSIVDKSCAPKCFVGHAVGRYCLFNRIVENELPIALLVSRSGPLPAAVEVSDINMLPESFREAESPSLFRLG